MNKLQKNFDIFLYIVKQSLKNELNEQGNIPKRGKNPKFSDAEVISLSILSESLMYDSENHLFKMMHNLKKYFPNLIHRSAYNHRCRALYQLKERVRQYLVQHMIQGEDTFVIDSMPIQISQFSRSKRIRICKDDYLPLPAMASVLLKTAIIMAINFMVSQLLMVS